MIQPKLICCLPQPKLRPRPGKARSFNQDDAIAQSRMENVRLDIVAEGRWESIASAQSSKRLLNTYPEVWFILCDDGVSIACIPIKKHSA